MRVLFAGGGTAGHINPALAVAGHIRALNPTAKILYVGAIGGMEERLVKEAGFDFAGVKISGFSRKASLGGLKKNVVTMGRIITAGRESTRILRRFKPDLCVGTGGYVSGPILRKAHKMDIPIIIHEQNAYPGVTNKLLSRKAKYVMLAVEAAKEHLKYTANVVVTGNPIRREIITAQREDSRAALGLDERPVVLSFGGSLGARAVNEAILDLIVHSARDDRFQHIHAYGQHGTWLLPELEKRGVKLSAHKNLDIREYINNMAQCLAAADIVICRAGAITLSEIQAKGKASILIPSPNVAENHQFHNAMALVNKKAAAIIEEKDLTGYSLIKMTEEILSTDGLLKNYQKNSADMAIIDANERIYSIIKKVRNTQNLKV